jgi:hypothetical protein
MEKPIRRLLIGVLLVSFAVAATVAQVLKASESIERSNCSRKDNLFITPARIPARRVVSSKGRKMAKPMRTNRESRLPSGVPVT